MEKRIIVTDKAPAAIGPYSQGVVAGNLLFVSGQLGVDPETGTMARGGASMQAAQCLRNVLAVVSAAGGNVSSVLKVTLYLTDLESFAQVNEVFRAHFPADPPARVTVEVSRLPKDALVEIDAVALVG